jgi:hypothetical protein
VVRPSNTCLLPRCGVPMDDFSFLCLSLVCEESPQLGASRPYNEDHKRCTEVREGRATHTRLKSQHNHARKSQLELKTQPTEFTTQMEFKSLSQRIKCANLESWRLRMFLECLDESSMRLGVPFIAPRQLGVVGGQQGRPKLPSVGWCTGQSGAPPDSHCRWSGADLFPFLAQMTIADSCPVHTGHCPVHTGQSGDPCRPLARATHRPRIARPAVALATVGSPDSPVHHQTVRLIIVVRRQIIPRVACSLEAGLAHRTLSGAPPDSPVCHAELDFGCTKQVFCISFFSCF